MIILLFVSIILTLILGLHLIQMNSSLILLSRLNPVMQSLLKITPMHLKKQIWINSYEK